MSKKPKKYKIIKEETIKNLIEFLDEIQFDAAKENTTEDMQKINFCNWAINELLNSMDGYIKGIKPKPTKNKPQKKSRDDYVEETFMDWNLPEMNDEDYEKLVDQFDAFLRGWEKEYLKDNPQKKSKKKSKKDDWKPRIEDVVQHCSLDEIRDMLLDDKDLTKQERFELYYEEHERIQKENEPKFSLDDMCKKLKINLPPKDKQN